jgi:hypothetical protein
MYLIEQKRSAIIYAEQTLLLGARKRIAIGRTMD